MLGGWMLGMLVVAAPPPKGTVRVATFNIQELGRDKVDKVDRAGAGSHPQLRKAAEILQRVRPHVVLINEIDYDEQGEIVARFLSRYLKVSQEGQPPIDYPHRFIAPTNTGLPTGMDLDNDGKTDGPADAYGFGRYPGQYGMALFSQYPIDTAQARTFQKLLWKDMPGNLMPDGTSGKPAWYTPDEVAIFRLSSKNHWDVPIKFGAMTVHMLCSHPTPPIFDGPEDHNGRRNFDEIRFWDDYLTGGAAAGYIRDDSGRSGGLAATARFVILGDLNADPIKSERTYGRPAIEPLLHHPRVRDPLPTSRGALEGMAAGPPNHLERKTCHFGRIDYALPDRGFEVAGTGVFWPDKQDPLYRLVSPPDPSSDHRLVWVDLVMAP